MFLRILHFNQIATQNRIVLKFIHIIIRGNIFQKPYLLEISLRLNLVEKSYKFYNFTYCSPYNL